MLCVVRSVLDLAVFTIDWVVFAIDLVVFAVDWVVSATVCVSLCGCVCMNSYCCFVVFVLLLIMFMVEYLGLCKLKYV